MIGPVMGGSPILKYSGVSVNIVFDGNSLVEGAGTSGPTKTAPAQLAQLKPLNGNVTVTNVGVSGQTIGNMRTRGTQYADGNYVAGKKNILIAWEGTNSVVNTTMTGAAAGAAMAAYCADRLAAHPDWYIILVTTLPRFDVGAGSWSVANANAELTSYDNYIKNNFRIMGAKKIIDVRAGGIFTYTGTTMTAAMSPYMNDQIHCNDIGYGVIAQYCANVLRRLPAR